MKTFILIALSTIITSAHADLFKETLELSLYKNNSNFYFTEHGSTTGVRLLFNIPTSTSTDEYLEPYVEVTIQCDKNFTVKEGGVRNIRSKKSVHFTAKNDQVRPLLILPQDANCTLNTESNFDSNKTIHLKSFARKFSILNAIQSENAIEVNRNSLFLPDGEDAINKRIEVLSGKRLTQEQLDARDPKMPLDIDPLLMPKFDFIYLSTLQINNDFVTNIIFRLLALHAQQGTPVVVTLSEVLIGQKEEKALAWLQEQSENIKIIRYKFDDGKFSIKKFINSLHRVSHSKLLITYSASNPSLNHFIGGGRNMSDRYFFAKKSVFNDPQFTDFEHEKLNPWVHFFDMDFEVNSPKLVRETLLNSLDFSEITHSGVKSKELDLSVPFRDDHQMEQNFIKQINSAHDSIEILSPYIYFTDDIKMAFKAAAERGVKIKIILSLSLLGDAMTKQLKDIYDSFINECSDYMEIYQYPTDDLTIMHRKGMLIDKKMVILGSVNMSQRSFVHDIESAFITDDANLIESVDKEINNMMTISHKIDRKFKSKFKFIEKLHIKNLL
jgi:phosphatidylserine/phosphatidylglycerophosphate/cardiolipin synthase-like enzyme